MMTTKEVMNVRVQVCFNNVVPFKLRMLILSFRVEL